MNSSKILVGIQFVSIALIMIPKPTIMIVSFWWVFPLLGLGLSLWIFKHNRLGNFNIVPEIKTDASLVTSGPYRWVRHPMYSALILSIWGVVLWHFCWMNLLLFTIMIAAVSAKASKEERLWLARDVAYADYKARSKMLIPFVL